MMRCPLLVKRMTSLQVSFLLIPFLFLLLSVRAKLAISFLITSTHKQHIKAARDYRSAASRFETNVTYSCRSNIPRRLTGNKGYCQNAAISALRVWNAFFSRACACQPASPFTAVTLMKGEKGNNQRSQYFSLDTDACSEPAGRRDLCCRMIWH